MTFFIDPNYKFWKDARFWLKFAVVCAVLVALSALLLWTQRYWAPPLHRVVQRLEQNSAPQPPQPVVVEWEVDTEYGDKRTTLSNGRKLTVYHDYESTSTDWHWTIGGVTSSEREAMDAALHMGGLK